MEKYKNPAPRRRKGLERAQIYLERQIIDQICDAYPGMATSEAIRAFIMIALADSTKAAPPDPQMHLKEVTPNLKLKPRSQR